MVVGSAVGDGWRIGGVEVGLHMYMRVLGEGGREVSDEGISKGAWRYASGDKDSTVISRGLCCLLGFT